MHPDLMGLLHTLSPSSSSSSSLRLLIAPRLSRDVVFRVIHALLILSDAFNWTAVAKYDAGAFAHATKFLS